MAITRAQQVRQMLEDGGMLVSPSRDGRRPGYRGVGGYRGGPGGSRNKGKEAPTTRTGVGGQTARTGPGNKTQAGGIGGSGVSGGSSSDKPTSYVPKSQIREIFKKPTIGDAFSNFAIVKLAQGLTDSEFNKRRKQKFLDDIIARSKRFQGVRNIKIPFLGEFDTNKGRQNANIIARLTAGLDFENLPKTEQDKIYDSIMDARMLGQTDAAGNLKAGFMFDAQGNIIPTGNDGRDTEAEQLALLAQNAQNQIPQSTAPTTTTSPLGGLGFRFLAEGGMTEDAPVGGIMDIESGRQMYFLGKLVKKATRAVKKVVKSPIGKAALVAGLGYGLGGGTFFGKMLPGVTRGGQGIGGFGGLSAIFGNVGDIIGGKTLGDSFAKFGASKLGLGITAASLLPLLGLGTGKEDEDEAEEILRGSGLDIASIRNNPYTFTSSVGGSGLARRFVADGGRIGFRDGTSEFMDFVRSMGLSEDKLKQLDINSYNAVLQAFQRAKEGQKPQTEEKEMAEGGKAEPVAKDTMPLLKMGGKEMDLRDNGGFVPIGRMERADDVPARLSKNEFVFTADAVRNAGGGDIDKGAEVMYNMMQNLESGGEVSEESQGLKGAREMFQTSKRLEEVL
jgi:hypothetical protein